jgi:hypothetical protein
MYCVSIIGLVGLGALMFTGVLAFLVFDYLAWSREWGGWLLYYMPEGYDAGSKGPPRLVLRIFFAVVMALIITSTIVLCVSILSNKPGDTKPYYVGCVVGKLHSTTSWWIYCGLAFAIFVFVAVFVFVMYRLNTKHDSADHDDDYVLMVDNF